MNWSLRALIPRRHCEPKAKQSMPQGAAAAWIASSPRIKSEGPRNDGCRLFELIQSFRRLALITFVVGPDHLGHFKGTEPGHDAGR